MQTKYAASKPGLKEGDKTITEVHSNDVYMDEASEQISPRKSSLFGSSFNSPDDKGGPRSRLDIQDEENKKAKQ